MSVNDITSYSNMHGFDVIYVKIFKLATYTEGNGKLEKIEIKKKIKYIYSNIQNKIKTGFFFVSIRNSVTEKMYIST